MRPHPLHVRACRLLLGFVPHRSSTATPPVEQTVLFPDCHRDRVRAKVVGYHDVQHGDRIHRPPEAQRDLDTDLDAFALAAPPHLQGPFETGDALFQLAQPDAERVEARGTRCHDGGTLPRERQEKMTVRRQRQPDGHLDLRRRLRDHACRRDRAGQRAGQQRLGGGLRRGAGCLRRRPLRRRERLDALNVCGHRGEGFVRRAGGSEQVRVHLPEPEHTGQHGETALVAAVHRRIPHMSTGSFPCSRDGRRNASVRPDNRPENF